MEWSFPFKMGLTLDELLVEVLKGVTQSKSKIDEATKDCLDWMKPSASTGSVRILLWRECCYPLLPVPAAAGLPPLCCCVCPVRVGATGTHR